MMAVPRRTRPDLAALARRVERLAPSHRDPEAFHAEKSEIAAELRQAASLNRRKESQ